MAGIAHEEDSAPEWFAAQFPNIGEASVGMFWDWMNAQADALGDGTGRAKLITRRHWN
ncbi:TPA: hypothetical protein ACRZF4_000614 [Escherichia coli]|uniref:hypothetical protein n=1 Tax=Enterobacter roggenkampii TaxID=1812935 RepID=UPI0016529C30|nr:hypothetical protein [Enterobacter roggenkampii]MDU5479350.1 hypothetical protein [Enterobacter sp.]MDU5499612.1 hypothetical protein [Enterobacter sp.]HCO8185844.1 hypothetical protein [Escherichia coli]